MPSIQGNASAAPRITMSPGIAAPSSLARASSSHASRRAASAIAAGPRAAAAIATSGEARGRKVTGSRGGAPSTASPAERVDEAGAERGERRGQRGPGEAGVDLPGDALDLEA